MSRQYSNRPFVPTRRHIPLPTYEPSSSSTPFSYATHGSYRAYPPHLNSQERVDPPPRSPASLNRVAAVAATPASATHQRHYRLETPSAASFTRHPPRFDGDDDHSHRTVPRASHHHPHHHHHSKRQRSSAVSTSNSQSSHHERKRSRPERNNRQQDNVPQPQSRSSNHHYPLYSNYRSNLPPYRHPIQPVPLAHQPRHFHHVSDQQPFLELRTPALPLTSTHRRAMPYEPLFHRPPMTTHIHPRSSPSFVLTNLLQRFIQAHAASYSDNRTHYHHTPPSASIDLIAYAWMPAGHEIFSLPTAFTIQFPDFFDLMVPDETPVVGLTDSELQRLPTMIYTKACTHISPDDRCAICLTEYTHGETLKHLRCKHIFHCECVEPWLKTSTRCPICRGEQTH